MAQPHTRLSFYSVRLCSSTSQGLRALSRQLAQVDAGWHRSAPNKGGPRQRLASERGEKLDAGERGENRDVGAASASTTVHVPVPRLFPGAVGQPLPTLPLWLSEELFVPVELEASYEETCRVLRIA